MPESRFFFDDCCLDPALRELRRDGELLNAEPQVFDLILYLLRNRDRVVSQEELRNAVWNGRLVSESTFRNRINAARRLLGDDGRRQSLIRTVARRGFRFVAEVRAEAFDTSVPENRTDEGAGSAVPSAPPESQATRAIAPAGFPEPVVAVLPFTNLSGNPDQEHVADGLTEDVITRLARHRSLSVIARNSAFSFKGHSGDVRDVGRALGAKYIVRAACA